MIHETGESYFSTQFGAIQGASPGLSQYPFLYPDMSGIGNSPTGPHDSYSLQGFYMPGEYSMSNMPRANIPSSGAARNQGTAGTGAGVTKRPSRPSRQATNITSQSASRAGASLGQSSTQLHGFDVDLTGMDYPTGSPNTMGLYGSTLNTGMDPAPFAPGSYNPRPGVGGGMQQQQTTPQPQGYRNMSPVPKFESSDLPSTPDFISPSQYDSFAEEERDTKPVPRRIRNPGTPTPAPAGRRRPSVALTDTSPATANTSSPANSSFASPDQPGSGGGDTGSTGGAQAAQPPGHHAAHVPPNRIQEAGPVTHPDPEWRPYGVNHWHVFLNEPTLLKYMSSTEIKDIRDHCYELAKPQGGGDDPLPVAEGSAHTTADAQAVWRHCDAYVRRRSQVRNNQAARRSRQRKDAETRYWKAKALEYGAPDHEFNWDLAEESPPGQGASSSSAVGGGGNQGQQGQGQGQQQQQQGERKTTRAQARAQAQGQGQGEASRGSRRQGQSASRRSSAPSGVKPDFDFNQPFDYDEDDKDDSGDFDAFTGGF